MKKFLVFLVLATTLFIPGCSNDTSTASSSSAQSEDTAATEEVTEETTDETLEKSEDEIDEELKAKLTAGIEGSNYIDIALNLEERGFPEHTTNYNEDIDLHFVDLSSYVDSETGATLSYSESYNDDFEVVSATFDILNTGAISNDLFLKFAESYLGFCSTMPYNSSDSEKAKNWVSENIATVHELEDGCSIVIGDAKFTLMGNMLDSGVIGMRTLYIEKDKSSLEQSEEPVTEN